MALSLKKLYHQASQNHSFRLVAGSGGLEKMVTWVHLIEDIKVCQFLHGYELIFTTGIAESRPDWITSFIKALHAQNASGLVLNIGPYIHEIPPDVLAYCDSIDFPLFTVPWEVKLVDITYDFCHLIITNEEREHTVAQSLKNAIYFPEDVKLYRPTLERQGFSDQASYCVAVLHTVPAADSRYWQQIRLHLQALFDQTGKKYSAFTVDEKTVLVLQNMEREAIRQMIGEVAQYAKTLGASPALHAGVSDLSPGLERLARLYRNAESALRIAVRRNEPVQWYADLGVYKILLSVEDKSVLEEIYGEYLKPLYEYDREHGTDYVQVLKCYLDHNASVQSVAKATYLHRNTINYKVRRIKEILNCDLTHEEKLRIALAFHIHELMG
ncbi:MAG: PucR family transcriptional regulator ligand-binding domain-containing protein [Eubacteriales bacterium]|nr:PucR family transcriptional regulator ligand-binding domain-containing protein [Eubacteriales bacterium]